MYNYYTSTGGGGVAEAEEHGNSVKIESTNITPVLHASLDFLKISLAFNTLVLIEVKLNGN